MTKLTTTITIYMRFKPLF